MQKVAIIPLFYSIRSLNMCLRDQHLETRTFINSASMITIPIGITQVQSWYGIAYSRQMASAVLAALSTVVLYLIFQRRVAEGVAITSGIR